jgi:hypothetical protein
MKNCWYHLNIDVSNALKKDWKFPDPQYNAYGIWELPSHDLFNQTWLRYTADLGLDFGSAMLFYRGPHMSTKGAHIDIATVEPLRIATYGLNWIIRGGGGEMIWYDTPSENTKILYTLSNTAYTNWPIDELNEIDRCTIAKEPTLVKVSNPHSITMGPNERWCISVRPFLLKTMEWDDVVNCMKKLGILVDR